MGVRIGILAYDGCIASSVMGPFDLLRIANEISTSRRGTRAPPFQVGLCTVRGQAVRASCGVSLEGPSLANLRPDVVFLPAIAHTDAGTLLSQLGSLSVEITALSRTAKRGATVAAACTGTFLLGESGILNGRSATSSWWLGALFRKRYPEVRFKPELIVVDDGSVITAGGATCYFDLSLQLVRRFVGPDLTRQVASLVLIEPQRLSQTPFVIDALLKQPRQGALERAERWLLRHLHEDLTIEDVAARCRVSSRTLLRRVRSAHGLTFVGYLQRLRTERAKSLLETTHLSFQEVAERCGYSDSRAFRRVFRGGVGMTPRDYRERFSLRKN